MIPHKCSNRRCDFQIVAGLHDETKPQLVELLSPGDEFILAFTVGLDLSQVFNVPKVRYEKRSMHPRVFVIELIGRRLFKILGKEFSI